MRSLKTSSTFGAAPAYGRTTPRTRGVAGTGEADRSGDAGAPESPMRWTCNSTHVLAAEMLAMRGISLCDKTVAKLLREHGAAFKRRTSSLKAHSIRIAPRSSTHQCQAQDCVLRCVPVISVDAKKRELICFKNSRRERGPKGKLDLADVYGFPSDAVGKAIPCGVYDIVASDGFSAWASTTTRRYVPSRRSSRGGSTSVRSATRVSSTSCRCGRPQRPPSATVEGRTASAFRRTQYRDPVGDFTWHQQVEQDRAPVCFVHLD